MKDVYFSYFMFALVGVASVLYGLRVLSLGRARSARAEQDGGSVFLSVGVMELGYWFLRPIVALLERSRVSANGITLFSIIPGLAAGVAIAAGWFGLASLLATIAAFCDALDGIIARKRGNSSEAGKALDSIVDRVTEFGLLGGLAVYFRFSLPLVTISVLALAGAYMISYTTAKAEAMGIKPPRGAMRRAERAVYLLVGCAATPIVARWVGSEAPVVLQHVPILLSIALIAVVANTSAALRTAAIMRMLDLRSEAAIDIRGPRPRTEVVMAETPSSPTLVAPTAVPAAEMPRAGGRGAA